MFSHALQNSRKRKASASRTSHHSAFDVNTPPKQSQRSGEQPANNPIQSQVGSDACSTGLPSQDVDWYGDGVRRQAFPVPGVDPEGMHQIRLTTSPPWTQPQARTKTDLATRPQRPARFDDEDDESDFDDTLQLLDATKGYRQIVAEWRGEDEIDVGGQHASPCARCRAYLVDTISPYHFYREMGEVSPSCGKLARAVFDGHGNMKAGLREEGTRVWHCGFGSKKILMIDQWAVLPRTASYSQLNQTLLQTLLAHVFANYRNFVAIIDSLPDPEPVKAEQVRISRDSDHERNFRTGILRTVGFRRIGMGQYFGYSPWEDSASRQLSAVEDY